MVTTDAEYETCTDKLVEWMHSVLHCYWCMSGSSTHVWHKEIILLTEVCGFCWYRRRCRNPSAVQKVGRGWISANYNIDILIRLPCFVLHELCRYITEMTACRINIITAIYRFINNIHIQYYRVISYSIISPVCKFETNKQKIKPHKREQPDAVWVLVWTSSSCTDHLCQVYVLYAVFTS